MGGSRGSGLDALNAQPECHAEALTHEQRSWEPYDDRLVGTSSPLPVGTPGRLVLGDITEGSVLLGLGQS